MPVLHETCTARNDITINNPIEGVPTVRKSLAGVWVRTIVCSGCNSGAGGAGGTGKCYGAGGSGDGVLIKEGTAADGGTTSRPEQTIMVWTGEA